MGGGGGLQDCGCVDVGEGEEQSEIYNTLLNQVVYCNVSCIEL